MSCVSGIEYKPHRVAHQSEVGDIHIATTFVAPWNEYVERLSPNFSLTSQQALEAVVPTTAISQEKFADTLAAALQVAPPTSSTAETETENVAADGTTTETSTSTETSGPGDLTKVPSVNATDPKLTGAAIPLPKDPKLEVDPFLQHTAATALYQEVQILNDYVRNAVQRHNATPYVVRIQITVAPYARNQPYDTHLNVSFFGHDLLKNEDRTTNQSDNERQAFVVPLLVTDNLEAQLSARSADIVRQLGAAATVLQGGFAASLGLDRRLEKLNAILANDLNSLLTVGRATRNSMYVRLGAMQTATAQYSMVPRNYNITALVLLEEPEGERSAVLKQQLRIASTVSYRDVESGELLPREDGLERVRAVQEVISDFQSKKGHISPAIAKDILLSIFTNDFREFKAILRDEEKKLGIDRLNERDFWNAIIERLGRSGYIGDNVDLPQTPDVELPGDQTVLLLDDGVNRTVASLIGGQGLDSTNLRAVLTVPLKDGGTIRLPAYEAAFDGPGRDPTFTFRSIAAWGAKPDETHDDSTHIPGAELKLSWKKTGGYERRGDAPKDRVTVPMHDVHYRQIGQEEPVYIRLGKTAFGIKPKDGKGKLRVHVEFLRPDGKAPAGLAELAIEGGDIVKATTATLADVEPSLGKITLSESTTLTLEMENLTTKSKVTVDAVAKQNDKPIGAKPPKLEIAVN